jgi:thioredoxin reductase
MYKKVACIHNPATGREQILPHTVEPSGAPGRKVVVVGGGPAGLEAARVSAERGHDVILFEAAPKLGGQLLIAAQASWRRDLIGIVEWRVRELERLGVDIRLNRFVEANDIVAEYPSAVIIATGGVPDASWLEGGELCASVWEVLADSEHAESDVIIYDGTGRHQAVSCALHLAEGGHHVQFVTLDDNVGLEMEYASRVIYRKRFAQWGVLVLIDLQLVRVRPSSNGLVASFRHELTNDMLELTALQVIIENGTMPVDDLFHELRVRSLNYGVTDIDALLARRLQLSPRPTNGAFELHRIGDAVTSRGVHSAIYDALWLCSAL